MSEKGVSDFQKTNFPNKNQTIVFHFFQTCEGRYISQPAALKAHTEASQCGVARAHGVVETCSLLPQALCRQSFVAVGAAFWCWLGTWLYMQHSSAAMGLDPMTPGDVA